MASPTQITLTKPDDWHLHLRDGALMSQVVKDSANFFGRALVMPNLESPVTTTEAALYYQRRILDALPANSDFVPMMTLYLTADTTPAEIAKAKSSGIVQAIKLYPAGATTNSSAGVHKIEECYSTLEAMQEIGMTLSIHGEVVDNGVDIFDREKVFIDAVLTDLAQRFPELKMVLEHLTTIEGVQFIKESGSNMAATITAHHLLFNRNDMLVDGIKPHLYCLPVVKTERDRKALITAAVSGNPKFFLGTDSAPHLQSQKLYAAGKAGIYSAHTALLLYAEIFEQEGKLNRLEAFASFFGADFYGLDRNQTQIKLIKENFQVPDKIDIDNDCIVPLKAGEALSWRIMR